MRRKFFSASYWVHLLINTIIGQGIWWVISMLLETPILARSIIAGIVLIASMFSVAWYLPKLAPRYATVKAKLDASPIYRKPSRLEYDHVLWEDGGMGGSWGTSIIVNGPFCPKDFTPLSAERNGKIETNPSDDTYISDSSYHASLFCLKCKVKYFLSTQYKTIKQSRNEVRNLFEGLRKQEQEGK